MPFRTTERVKVVHFLHLISPSFFPTLTSSTESDQLFELILFFIFSGDEKLWDTGKQKNNKLTHLSISKLFLGLFLETPPIILKRQIKLISSTLKNLFEGGPEKEHVR